MMIKLPKSTEFNRRIPKQKFYEKLDIPTSLKRKFINEIKIIYWKNKISSDTTNFRTGYKVKEIEVIEVQLNQKKFDESLIKQIDQTIPYHIVFVLKYEEQVQLIAGYKTVEANKKIKVSSYFQTEWHDENSNEYTLTGISLDEVYEKLIRDIAGENITQTSINEPLEVWIEQQKKKEELEKKIEKLTQQRRKEKQLNKQIEINSKIKKMKKELKENS